MSGIRALVVPIPVRDEEALLPATLVAVTAAVDHLRAVRPELTTRLVVALDRCTDRSATIAQAHGALTVQTVGRGVGASRDTAIRHGLGALGWPEESTTWVACTDADTLVPPGWLVRHVLWAEQGADVLIGTVEPCDVEDPRTLAAWHDRHRLAEGHDHVHGANLGVRASCWRAAGGFGDLVLHEDVGLVGRIRSGGGAVCVATDTTRVRTSGRAVGRLQGGFATYLTEVAAGAR